MNAPSVRPTADGPVLKVRVSPGARSNTITGVHGDALKVRVASPPEKGRANRALERLLAGALHVEATAVEVVRGAASRNKHVVVRTLDATTLRERIREILVTLGAR